MCKAYPIMTGNVFRICVLKLYSLKCSSASKICYILLACIDTKKDFFYSAFLGCAYRNWSR